MHVQEMKLSQYHSKRLNFIYLFMILLRKQFLKDSLSSFVIDTYHLLISCVFIIIFGVI